MTRFLTFSAVSALGAAIDLILGVTFLGLGLSSWAALALAMPVSATLVYALHQKITFGDLHSRDLNRGRLVTFLASTAAIYVFRVVVFEFLRGWGAPDVAALCVALVASVAVNYTVSRVVIFARPKGGGQSWGTFRRN